MDVDPMGMWIPWASIKHPLCAFCVPGGEHSEAGPAGSQTTGSQGPRDHGVAHSEGGRRERVRRTEPRKVLEVTAWLSMDGRKRGTLHRSSLSGCQAEESSPGRSGPGARSSCRCYFKPPAYQQPAASPAAALTGGS